MRDSVAARGHDPKPSTATSQTSGNAGIGSTSFGVADPDERRRRELAQFLKAKRAGIAPESVGLRRTWRRRARGLLREEVAQRAGISPTWYVWLEQGRDIRPSADVLEHLADALALTDSERAYLLALARTGVAAKHVFSCAAPPALTAWLDGLDQPAYAINGRCDVLGWNRPATALLGDFASVVPADRNIMRMIFLWPEWRRRFVDWDRLAASAVAQFRASTARYAGTAELAAFVRDLAHDSGDFAALWNARGVETPQLKVKRMQHPELGAIDLTYAQLQPKGVAADLSVIVYSPQNASAPNPMSAADHR